MVIEYVGTIYHGFQIQPGVPTIQGELEKAIINTTGRFSRIHGAGRTDAGVHAKGQVAAFKTDSILSGQEFTKALNFYLPKDIAVKDAYQVDANFDPRRHAKSREYRYTLYNHPTRSPLNRKTSYHVSNLMDLGKMGQAISLLEGEHDFASFTNSEGRNRNTIRRVFRAQVRKEGDLILFDIVANAFLPQQVRRIMGSLLKISRGDMDITRFKELITAEYPGVANDVAPSKGLCLMKVNYT